MAKLSSDGKYVTVERGDTLTQIAVDYAGGYSKYKQLAAINNISNPDLIFVGQKIYLTNSGSSGSGSSTSANSNKPIIKQFGLQSNISDSDVLFATWDWSKSNTESYKVLWTYDTGNGVWFEGSNATNTVDADAPELSRQSTFTVPDNARRVQFKVKPISKKKTVNNKETSYWEAQWSDVKTYTNATPLETPPVPNPTIEKYKLTATLDGLDIDATGIEFEVVKDNAAKVYRTGKAQIVTGHASYSCTVDAGSEYKVRCRAYKGSDYSDWTAYSANVGAMPSAPDGITSIKATSKTSVYLEWASVKSADFYDIEYTTKLRYFDSSDAVTQKSVEGTHFELTGLESGQEYFFRVRAGRDEANDRSEWCEPKSIRIGDDPAAPTTYSSTTTAIRGEALNLYWIHNSADGSTQTHAELELTIGGTQYTYTLDTKTVDNSIISYIPLSEEDREAGKTNTCQVKTSSYSEGTKILWRVRTAGVTLVYGEWSVQRTVDIYAPPTLDLSLTDSENNSLQTVTAFPIDIRGKAGPPTQAPLSYHVTITSTEVYETVDNAGNPRVVNRGEEVYSRHFDISTVLKETLSAGDIDLENNVKYILTCTVAMNSGLKAEASLEFNVTWEDMFYEPNAEISIDTDAYTAAIRPYCRRSDILIYRVEFQGGNYVMINRTIASAYGDRVPDAWANGIYPVYHGTTDTGEDAYFCYVEVIKQVEDVLLSVYRREFDGSLTELATGLDNSKFTTITDPHPSLDYARYRIVATSKSTGAVSFYDPPGYPVGGFAIIVQWDEEWSNFETSEESSAFEQPPWSGSLLKLPYNIKVSDSNQPDVELVEFVGRRNPVAYYGTQRGTTSNWNTVIPARDKETLYALRRLQNWMGNVYVREPSGSGYWAHIKVSFSQSYDDLTIPVTLNVTRVEGGA